MDKRSENVICKLPYSTPNLFQYSRDVLASRIRKSGEQDHLRAENRLQSEAIQPPPVVIEGFDGDVRDLLRAMSWMGSGSGPGFAGEPGEKIPDSRSTPVANAIGILLVDMRHGNSELRGPMTHMGSDPAVNATLVLILTGSVSDLTVASEFQHSDPWRFSGAITVAVVGIVAQSVCKIWMAAAAQSAEPSSTIKAGSSKTSEVAYAERD